ELQLRRGQRWWNAPADRQPHAPEDVGSAHAHLHLRDCEAVPLGAHRLHTQRETRYPLLREGGEDRPQVANVYRSALKVDVIEGAGLREAYRSASGEPG